MRSDKAVGSVTVPIQVVKALDLSPADIARWMELQRSQARLDSPFLSPHWALAVARAQGDKGEAVKVAIVRGADKRLSIALSVDDLRALHTRLDADADRHARRVEHGRPLTATIAAVARKGR